jgi:Bacterial Ig-like domain (group 2)/Regulator of chromosome condensation (RCC1) repeat/Bacterial Ig-like domain (group 1)
MKTSRAHRTTPACAAVVLFAIVGYAAGCGGDGPTEPPRPSAVVATSATTQSAQVATAVSAPPAVKVTSASGGPLGNVTVTFAIAEGGGSLTGATQQTDANGVATVGTWTLGTTAGANAVTATVAGLAPVRFAATGTPGPPASVTKHAGDNQSATVGQAVATRPAVIVKDAHGNLVAGATVTFAVTAGGGSVTGASPTTDASGVATVGAWTLGTTAGANALTATASGIDPIGFTATGTPAAPASLTKHAGDGQSATVNEAVATNPTVLVTDSYGNPISGATVTFSVTSGGGSVTGGTSVTDAAGKASVGSWTLGKVAGSNTLNASVPGVTAAVFSATGRAGAAATITISPDRASIEVDEQKTFTATAHDAYGNATSDGPIEWSTSNSTIATVDASGTVTGRATGIVSVTARVGSVSGTPASVQVVAPVASITMTPESATVVLTITTQLRAIARDAAGNWLHERQVTWSSSNPAVVAVSPYVDGVIDDDYTNVTGKGAGDAIVTATVGRMSATARVRSLAVQLSSVTAGWSHTCGLSAAGEAYCWGSPAGRGDGSSSSRSYPLPVATDLRFTSLHAGSDFTCGLVAGGAAYCWGILGGYKPFPTQVSGGLTFTSLSAWGNACGLTAEGAAYCWGSTPVLVPGGLVFRSVAAGRSHNCGVTNDHIAYCWGSNDFGQLGDGTKTTSSTPVPVAGNLRFKSVSAGGSHTCGITTDDVSYCWGWGPLGQLGTGFTSDQLQPAPVSGGHRFAEIVTGLHYSCGRTPAGDVYCWGDNQAGSSDALDPVLRPGLRFSSIAAGAMHTCGMSSGVAYCWGENNDRQLGDGGRNVGSPVRVVGQP